MASSNRRRLKKQKLMMQQELQPLHITPQIIVSNTENTTENVNDEVSSIYLL